MTTPGKQSREGVIFEIDHPRAGRRLLDYIFDGDAPVGDGLAVEPD